MRGIRQVEVVKVIKTNTVIGKGTEEDPVRGVIQYWDMEGRMIAEEDDYEESKKIGRRLSNEQDFTRSGNQFGRNHETVGKGQGKGKGIKPGDDQAGGGHHEGV